MYNISNEQKLEVSQPTFLKYEKGSVSIRDNILMKLSNLFNVSVDYILCKSNIRKIDNNAESMLCNYKNFPIISR